LHQLHVIHRKFLEKQKQILYIFVGVKRFLFIVLIILLYLAYPDYDGGSPVIDFEVQVTNPDSSSRIVYRGRDLDCTVAGLLPGRPYLFQVRAFNRAGVWFSIRNKKKQCSYKLFFRLVHGPNILMFFLVPVYLKHREIFLLNVKQEIVL
jgi:hypothetical protein